MRRNMFLPNTQGDLSGPSEPALISNLLHRAWTMRKKLRLQIEQLCVEQFETHLDVPETVQSMTEYHSCGGITIEWGEPCICLDMPSNIC